MVEETRPPQPEPQPPAPAPQPPGGGGVHWGALLAIFTLGVSAVIDLLLRGTGAREPAVVEHAPSTAPAPQTQQAVGHEGEEVRHPDGGVEHPSVRHEKSDASFRWIFGIILGAMGFAAFVHWVILMFFYDYNNYESAIRKSPYPLRPTPSEELPRGPRLEQLDRVENIQTPNIRVRQQQRENILGSYGTTPEKGFVRVPIDQAIKHLAGKGKLPVREQPKGKAKEEPHDRGLVDSGESNSGRMFRKEPRWFER